MADSTSSFSQALASTLRGVMAERGISQQQVVERLDRSAGFVSERVGGKRPLDTDFLDAVAHIAGVETRELVGEILERMRRSQNTDFPELGGGEG